MRGAICSSLLALFGSLGILLAFFGLPGSSLGPLLSFCLAFRGSLELSWALLVLSQGSLGAFLGLS